MQLLKSIIKGIKVYKICQMTSFFLLLSKSYPKDKTKIIGYVRRSDYLQWILYKKSITAGLTQMQLTFKHAT